MHLDRCTVYTEYRVEYRVAEFTTRSDPLDACKESALDRRCLVSNHTPLRTSVFLSWHTRHVCGSNWAFTPLKLEREELGLSLVMSIY
jgi:hypothetical protein